MICFIIPRVNTRGKEFEPTDLNEVIQLVLRDLRMMIDEWSGGQLNLMNFLR